MIQYLLRVIVTFVFEMKNEIRIILLIILICSLNAFSQNSENFETGVKIIENKKIEEYDKPKSILFIFKGHTHYIYYFLDLKKRLRKTFRKNLKKDFKSFKLNFNYDLNTENPLEVDLKNIPSKKYNEREYELICQISISDIKGWDNHLIKKRKVNYNINIEIKEVDSRLLTGAKLNVNSYFTIITQNKESGKLIYNAIMGD